MNHTDGLQSGRPFQVWLKHRQMKLIKCGLVWGIIHEAEDFWRERKK